MADDDWDPDLDFPGLDSSAVITDVGVDQFVLCLQVRDCSSLDLCTLLQLRRRLRLLAVAKPFLSKPHPLALACRTQTKIEPMLHITIVLHKGLNGPLTGTGAMEAPGAGAGATMTLEVDFQTPGQEGTHHMSMPIGQSVCVGMKKGLVVIASRVMCNDFLASLCSCYLKAIWLARHVSP